MGKTGRKGKYHKWITDDGLKKLEAWARDGLTDEQVAHNIGINRATLYAWKNRYPNIDDALKRGKEVVDIEVENKLLQKALGFEYEETETWMEEVDGKQKKRVKRIKRHALPDTTAQIFWLKNRKPVEWRDKQQIDITKDSSEQVNEMQEYIEELKKKNDADGEK